MNRQKRILQMTKAINRVQSFGTKWFDDKYEPFDVHIENYEIAGELVQQGYCHQSETAQEIWDDCIDKIMRGCGDDKEFWVMKILIETFKKYGVGFDKEG